MAQINPRTFADAAQLADGIYELILTNWGNKGRAADANNGSIHYPPVKNLPGTSTAFLPQGAIPIVSPSGDFLLPPIPSLVGIAISPRSDIDTCLLHFSSLPHVPAENTLTQIGQGGVLGANGKSITIQQGLINYGGILETEQQLSVRAPIVGPLPGPIIVRAHWTTYFADSYVPVEPAGMQTFGTALNALATNAGPGVFKVPELRLLLYMSTALGAALPPTRRAPYRDAGSLIPFYPSAGAVPPVVYPCSGRRTVRVGAINNNGVPVRLRVEGVRPSARANFGSTPTFGGVATELALITIGANSNGNIKICDPGCPFITLTALDGPALGSSIDYEIALDD